MILHLAEPEIRAALERLLAVPEAARPCVIVRAVKLDRYVQFVGSSERALTCDLPLVAQRVTPRFPWAGWHSTKWGVQWRNVSPAQGAILATLILRDGFGVPDAWEIAIVEELGAGAAKGAA